MNEQQILAQTKSAKDACPACQSLGECLMGCHGWLWAYDRATTEEMNGLFPNYGPVFGVYKCNRRLEFEQAKISKTQIPERFAARTWGNFQADGLNKKAFLACKDYAESLGNDTKSGLLICGGVGVGKTHLAVAILGAAFKKGMSAALVYIPDLLADLRDQSIRGLAEKVRSRRFLVLDDLGAEKASEWTEQELVRLINYRYEHMLPTVITTNLSSEELVSKLGARGADRLNEMCTPVVVGGRSRRKEMRQEVMAE